MSEHDDSPEGIERQNGSVDPHPSTMTALDLMDEAKDDMACHWSPFCDREGVRKITTHINDKPFVVWCCGTCGP